MKTSIRNACAVLFGALRPARPVINDPWQARIKVHVFDDGRIVTIYGLPKDRFTLAVSHTARCYSARIANPFHNLESALYFARLVFGITEWNIQ